MRRPRPRPAALAPLALLAPLAALLAACASAPATGRDAIRDPAAGSQVTTRIDGGGTVGSTEIRAVSNPVEGVESYVPAGPDQAFAVLPAAYEALGLPINTVLRDARTLGVRDGRAPRHLARQPLSRYLDCGAEAAGARHADAWDVTITALSRITASGDASSTVVTQVAASARPVSTSGASVSCTSTGRLEQTINAVVVARLRM